MKKLAVRIAFVVSTALMLTTTARAADPDWPQWRGPNFDGSSAAAGLPDKLDPANAAWTTDLPGPSSGTPAVWGDRVFVSALEKESKKLLGMCVSRKDGKVLWQRDIGIGYVSNNRNNAASPSPVTDGKLVYFHYASGDLAAFDMEGKQVWARNLVTDYGTFNYMWIYGSSPLLYKGKLYVQVVHRDRAYSKGNKGNALADSFLLALDPATGKELWRQVRPSDANDESKESYATPVPFEHEGKSQIVVIGGDAVTGHDAETGQEIWRYGGWNPEKIGHWRMVASVASGAGNIFASPPKGGPLFAIRAGGQGDITQSHTAWRNGDFTTDVCVPLFYKGKLYILDGDKKQLACLDPATGKPMWTGALKSGPVFRASPTAGDGKIYCMNEGGEVWVVSADEFKILYQGQLSSKGDASRASIALAQGQAFVRTADKLYCFGGK